MTTTIEQLIKQLFEKLAHIGHRTSLWNPKMRPYLHMKKNGVHVFDLNKTAEHLEKAVQFLKAVKLQNGKVLFVGTKPQTALILKKKVAETDHFYIDQKWQPGLLTNFTEIRRRIDHYLNLKSQFETGEIQKYTKKEISAYKKELDKLDKMYSGVSDMRKKPTAVVVLDAVADRLAIEEAAVAGIAIVAVTDSNANPDKIDYIIPANDDSIKSIEFVVDTLMSAFQK